MFEVIDKFTGKKEWWDLARAAYYRYGEVVGMKNYQGKPMPQWEDLPPKIQEAWGETVKYVWERANKGKPAMDYGSSGA